jgi:hypothetical protein
MIKIIDDFISLDKINNIIDFYKNKPFKHQGYHPEKPEQLQLENSNLDQCIIEEILHENIVKVMGDDYKISNGCGMFQRCYLPFGMHTDSKKRIDPGRTLTPDDSEGVALLIPLQEAPEFNTVFWDIKFVTDQEKNNSFLEFGKMPPSEIKNSNLGDRYDLEFCWGDPNNKLYNHYPFLGVFNWKLGSAAIWDRNHLHAATDFTKKHPYKDAITIFFE